MGVYEFTRWGRATKPKGKPAIPTYTSHFSILYTELHGVLLGAISLF